MAETRLVDCKDGPVSSFIRRHASFDLPANIIGWLVPQTGQRSTVLSVSSVNKKKNSQGRSIRVQFWRLTQ